MSKAKDFYKHVADYFDVDAKDFEDRYDQNPVLQRIRRNFQEETEKLDFSSMLEIGCGPGFDMEHFAKKYPKAKVYGIDIAPKMIQLAKKRLKGRKNAVCKVGSVEDLPKLFPKKKFDLIYCYFGALNTVHNLEKAAKQLESVLAPGGKLVLTFINSWYLADIAVGLCTLRPKKALSRLGKAWGGYSPKRYLESTPRSRREIRKAFDNFTLVHSHSYSIVFPAWYRAHWPLAKGLLGKALWSCDAFLRHTPFKDFGEYSLYVFEKH